MVNYRKLNNIPYTDYDGIRNFIISVYNNGLNNIDNLDYPAYIQPEQRQDFFDNYSHLGINENNYLDYNEDLIVVPDDERDEFLTNLYNDRTLGFGKGIQTFYLIVKSLYLNISRSYVENWLKHQEVYQLTRQYTTPKIKAKRYRRKNQCWYIDLIDMTPYKNHNQNYKYILSVLDAKTKVCYLRELFHKSAIHIRNQMQPLIEAQPAQYPVKLIISDNGGEFKGEFDEYLSNHNPVIRHHTTETHTPEPHIENLNGQVRRLLSQFFVVNQNLNWRNILNDIELNIHNLNATRSIMNDTQGIEEPEPEEPAYNNLAVGDLVRIRMTALDTRVRKKIKEKEGKHIHLKWSLWIFRIRSITPPQHPGGLPTYTVFRHTTNEIIFNLNNNGIRHFKHIDLMKIPANTINNFHEENFNFINNT